jgi:ABC-2 type transport system permease protein
MSVGDIQTIAARDLRTAWQRRGIRRSLVLFPTLVAVGIPLILRYSAAKSAQGIPASVLTGRLLTAFLFFFVLGAATLPSAIAAYSFVGEKIERTLEPLLATPATDADILLGKAAAAWFPAMAATWVGMAVFMVITDVQYRTKLGYLYFPNPVAWVLALLVAPLTAALSVELNIIISARATDVRSAQQTASLVVLPFAALYVLTEIGVVALDVPGLLLVAAVLVVLVMLLGYAARATFNREEILTRWR